MKIVACPDSFKGSLPSVEAADAIERGILRALASAEVIKLPLADGGEGTVDALVRATCGETRAVTVKDPLLRDVQARIGILGDGETAAVEMASASGLYLLSESQRNPLITTTYGTGQLLLAAADTGARRIIIGIGGSATNDGGAGSMTALGARFLDADGVDLPPGGAALADLHHIDLTGFSFPPQVALQVASDVTNPLCGPNGASAVYGPQKGATPGMVAILDAALARLAEVIRTDLGKDVADLPGAGAAGGLGAALMAFLGAEMRSGIETVLEAVDFDRAIVGADLIITGEGRLDSQTAAGKVISGVLKRSKPAGIPVIALAGSIEGDISALHDSGLTAAHAITPAGTDLATAMSRTDGFLETAAERIIRALI